jgi:hypothetical protein
MSRVYKWSLSLNDFQLVVMGYFHIGFSTHCVYFKQYNAIIQRESRARSLY